MPMPGPPLTRFVPAVEEVNERRGITVVIDRQPNLCHWAVHSSAGTVIAGPRSGDASNPSNRQLAAQISAAVSSTGAAGIPVFTADWATAELLRAKTDLPVSDLTAPQAAITAAREAIAAVEKKLVTGLTLACDASRGKGKDVNGCGWILAYSNGADPAVGGFTTVSENGGIRAGELSAIRRGLQSTLALHPVLRDGAGDLTVLTDSMAALDLLERVKEEGYNVHDSSDCVQEARRILGSARGVNIRFQWVRGHDGHVLNELADRLAVLSRRNREMGVDEVTHARMMAGVRTDAREICAATGGR
ncbi:RNase H family protein [Arthrobacter sp. H14]|uniref:RNase H family protein n=1 Tax=Arthrobacter sp. H14 TaxID=1312959 RepID=UPI0020A6C7DE|nr:RNase H family protein [Arthrobacter sp. H14]